MPGPGLITDYLTTLSGQLPAPIVEELADGLDQTRQHYLDQGMDPDAAAGAAVAEFGEPHVIVAASPGSARPDAPPAGCWRPGRRSAPAGRPS
jgi:hypothetical protein